MMSFIITVAVFAVLGGLTALLRKDSWYFFSTLVAGLFIGTLVMGIIGPLEQSPQVSETQTIVSLQQFEGAEGHVSGNFLWISGDSGSVPCYGYYVLLSDGGLKPEQICSSSVRVYEDAAPDTATITTYTWPSKFMCRKWGCGQTEDYVPAYDINVPPGTIRQGSFNLGFPNE